MAADLPFLLNLPKELLLRVISELHLSDLNRFRLANHRCNDLSLATLENPLTTAVIPEDGKIKVSLDKPRSFEVFSAMSRSQFRSHITTLEVLISRPLPELDTENLRRAWSNARSFHHDLARFSSLQRICWATKNWPGDILRLVLPEEPLDEFYVVDWLVANGVANAVHEFEADIWIRWLDFLRKMFGPLRGGSVLSGSNILSATGTYSNLMFSRPS